MPARIFQKIAHSNEFLQFPNNFDQHATSIIQKLLQPNAATRLGALKGGVGDIKSHSFFVDTAHFNWVAVSQLSAIPPHVPR